MRPHFGQLDTHHELELIEEITGDPARGLALLAEGVPRIFRAGWALIVERDGDRSFRLAESAAAPETREGDLHWLPLKRAVVIDPDAALGAGAVDRAGHRAGRGPVRGRPAGAGRRPARAGRRSGRPSWPG